MTVVGIDACKRGWIVVALGNGPPVAFFIATIDRILDVVPDITTIAIDIPIGLPEKGHRAADRLAFEYVGPRRNSVFTVPVREALEVDDFAEANRISFAKSGSGISKQSHALRFKILEVDGWLNSAPCQIFEVHPEVSFRKVSGAPIEYSKKSWAGMDLRRRLLQQEGIDLDAIVDHAGESAGIDDLLDAAVAGWSAQRIERGMQGSFPSPPEMSQRNIPMAIWF